MARWQIPGVGDATIEVEKKIVQLNKLIEITTDNVDQYVAQGL